MTFSIVEGSVEIISGSTNVAIQNGSTLVGSSSGFPAVGIDGSTARFISVDSVGTLYTKKKKTTADVTSSIVTDSSLLLLTASDNRTGFFLQNDSYHNLYVKFGSSVTTSSYSFLLQRSQQFEDSFSYSGDIYAVREPGDSSTVFITIFSDLLCLFMEAQYQN